MVASVGSQRPGHMAASKPSVTDDVQLALRGKSADSVGHRVKAEIALYSEEVDVLANIRGKVASMIARGELDRIQNVPVETPASEDLSEISAASTAEAPTSIDEPDAGPPESEINAPGSEPTENI